MEEANKLIGTGKRHLIMGDAMSAVSVLQEACSMLAKKYGDTADECGEAFFLCGKALLELARMENTVLGNALKGVLEEDTEEEDTEEEEENPKNPHIESTVNADEKTRDELRVQVYDAMAEKEKNKDSEKKVDETDEKEVLTSGHVNGSGSAHGEEKQNGANGAEVQKGSAEHPEAEKEKREGEEEGEQEDGEGTEDEDSDDEEEVENLQLAWEMLEVAKVIYKRKQTKKDQLLLAQAHLKLGEVATESGNYTQAVEDFQECLALQLKHLPSDSRLLAETHCQLGLTLSLTSEYNKAIGHFNSSIAVIQMRLAEVQKGMEEIEGPEAASLEKEELEELNALLPNLRQKIEDATEGLKMATDKVEALKGVMFGSSHFPAPSSQNGSAKASMITVKSSNGNASTNSATSDISHLVRKKRKSDVSPVKECKKAKQEPCGHGSGESKDHKVEEKMDVAQP